MLEATVSAGARIQCSWFPGLEVELVKSPESKGNPFPILNTTPLLPERRLTPISQHQLGIGRPRMTRVALVSELTERPKSYRVLKTPGGKQNSKG